MKHLLAHLLARFFRRLLGIAPRSRALFRLCRMYVNFYEGDDNPAIDINGEAAIMRRLLPASTIAFDVGAHRGEWAAMALSINPSLVIHCFEPASATFEQLSRRLMEKPSDQIVLNHCALSDRSGTASLHLHEASPDVNSLHAADAAGIAPETGTETVTLQTLDEYCAALGIEHIDYLKIDVEGHEFSVLQGAREMLAKGQIRYVQLEYGPGYLQAGKRLSDIFALLCPLGYRANKITPKGLMPREYSPELETFKLSNWMFVKK